MDLDFYDDEGKMRTLLLKLNRIKYTEQDIPDSWTATKLKKEREIRASLIREMTLSQLREEMVYYPAIYNNHENFFWKNAQICESLTRGTLSPDFVHKKTELHRYQCVPYATINVPTVVYVSATAPCEKKIAAILEDPYGSINAYITNPAYSAQSLANKYILANIMYSSCRDTEIDKIRILP